jgi:starvation-inducible DNA-binding protein
MSLLLPLSNPVRIAAFAFMRSDARCRILWRGLYEGINMANQEFDSDTVVAQAFGELAPVRIGLSNQVRYRSVVALNRMLAHTLALRDLYRKNHLQTSGATFYQLHLLFDKHHGEQDKLADAIAERVQTLGGVALALAQDVVQETRVSRAPRGRETPVAQLSELVGAHEMILMEARALAREATDRGDDGTNDLLVSQVVRSNENQCWFVGEHLVLSD